MSSARALEDLVFLVTSIATVLPYNPAILHGVNSVTCLVHSFLSLAFLGWLHSLPLPALFASAQVAMEEEIHALACTVLIRVRSA